MHRSLRGKEHAYSALSFVIYGATFTDYGKTFAFVLGVKRVLRCSRHFCIEIQSSSLERFCSTNGGTTIVVICSVINCTLLPVITNLTHLEGSESTHDVEIQFVEAFSC